MSAKTKCQALRPKWYCRARYTGGGYTVPALIGYSVFDENNRVISLELSTNMAWRVALKKARQRTRKRRET